MTKLLSGLAALALVGALGAGTAVAKDKHAAQKGASANASSMGRTMSSQCKPGHRWVKGYTKKNGQKVKGYCR